MSLFETILVCGLAVFATATILYFIFAKLADDSFTGYMAAFFGAGLSCAFWIPVLCGLIGVRPDYGTGSQDGFLVAVAEKGIIFTTTESELQVGTGVQAAVQSHFEFSATDRDIVKQLHDDQGKHVIIHYHEWYAAPWSQGETDYIADGVTIIQ
jgi:hypothetical protein